MSRRGEALAQAVEGLRLDQKIRFYLYKIGEISEAESGPELNDYWPEMPGTEQAGTLPEDVAQKVEKALREELAALQMLGDRGGRAITLEDKCREYTEAMARLKEQLAAEVWVQPATWAEFKKILAKEVALGPYV